MRFELPRHICAPCGVILSVKIFTDTLAHAFDMWSRWNRYKFPSLSKHPLQCENPKRVNILAGGGARKKSNLNVCANVVFFLFQDYTFTLFILIIAYTGLTSWRIIIIMVLGRIQVKKNRWSYYCCSCKTGGNREEAG